MQEVKAISALPSGQTVVHPLPPGQDVGHKSQYSEEDEPDQASPSSWNPYLDLPIEEDGIHRRVVMVPTSPPNRDRGTGMTEVYSPMD